MGADCLVQDDLVDAVRGKRAQRWVAQVRVFVGVPMVQLQQQQATRIDKLFVLIAAVTAARTSGGLFSVALTSSQCDD